LTTASRRRAIVAVCCLAQFMAVLDVYVVNVALAPIRADLGFSTAGLGWVVNAYTLAAAGCLLPGGRAADLLGRRRVFAAGLALFALASLAGGLAGSPAALIAARAAQGIGSAVIAPTSLSILAATHPRGRRRARAFGMWGTLGALGGASGALLGGLLTDALSWRWVLFANALLAAALTGAALRVVPTAGRRDRAARVSAPLLPLALLRSRRLSGALAAGLCLGAAATSMWFLLSLYVQEVLGYSPAGAGLTLLPMSLVILVCTQAASRMAPRLGPGPVLSLGMTLLGTGLLLLSRTSQPQAPALLCAAGIGCSFVTATLLATGGVEDHDSGAAAGLLNTTFQIGGSVGLALITRIAADAVSPAGGLRHAFACAAAFALAGALLARRAGRPIASRASRRSRAASGCR
jgi:MFS family permease